jgi:hypothetical protein
LINVGIELVVALKTPIFLLEFGMVGLKLLVLNDPSQVAAIC